MKKQSEKNYRVNRLQMSDFWSSTIIIETKA